VHFARLANALLKDEESSRGSSHVFACNFLIHRFKIFKTRTLSNKPFLIWLVTTPPHLKYAATLPFNLSLMAYFADINVSQGSVATYARCGGNFNMHLTTNLTGNLPMKRN